MTVFAQSMGDDIVLTAELAPGELAYVDAAWIGSADEGPLAVAAIHYLDGSVRFGDGPPVSVPDEVGPDAAARLALAAVAGEAAAAVDGVDPELIDVTGTGVVAGDVERLLGITRGEAWRADRPQAIVDTTGNPVVLAAAFARVADLGIVVLAGETSGRELQYDFYPHVHVRGLRIVGLAPPLHEPISWSEEQLPVVPPFMARRGSPLRREQRWYRLSSSGEIV